MRILIEEVSLKQLPVDISRTLRSFQEIEISGAGFTSEGVFEVFFF